MTLPPMISPTIFRVYWFIIFCLNFLIELFVLMLCIGLSFINTVTIRHSFLDLFHSRLKTHLLHKRFPHSFYRAA